MAKPRLGLEEMMAMAYQTEGTWTSSKQTMPKRKTLMQHIKENPDSYFDIFGIEIQNKKLIELLGRKRVAHYTCYFEGDGTSEGEIVKIELLDRNRDCLGVLWQKHSPEKDASIPNNTNPSEPTADKGEVVGEGGKIEKS